MTVKNYRMFAIALLAVVVMSAAIPAYAQFSVLYNFGSHSGDPEFPGYGPLAQGGDGSLYGTTGGGTHNSGTVFKITPAGNVSVLYNFCSLANCTDGSGPLVGLTLRPDGHFIGTTFEGGNNNCFQGCGTIFDITSTGTLTTLYKFTGGQDAFGPTAAPILGPDGSFYGTTQNGGSKANCGTLYRITGNVFTTLHTFDVNHGCHPTPLVLGTDGNLYGATINGAGTFFQVKLRTGMAALVTVLYNFDGYHGFSPSYYSAPVQGSDGNFYGTTIDSISSGSWVIYKITPTGTPTVLYILNGSTDGNGYMTGLTQASDGNFYGAAAEGGNSSNCPDANPPGCGTLFQVTPAGSFSVLHNFEGTTGSDVVTTPFQHTNGRLYGGALLGGTGTGCGGTVGCGVFYSWDAGLPAFVSMVPFMGQVGHFVEILGQGFTPSTTVSFNGTPATATVVSGTYLKTTVPAGATTGFITVTTSSGTLTSNRQFVVMP